MPNPRPADPTWFKTLDVILEETFSVAQPTVTVFIQTLFTGNKYMCHVVTPPTGGKLSESAGVCTSTTPVKWTSDWMTCTTWCVLFLSRFPVKPVLTSVFFLTCTSDTWTVVCGSCQSWVQSPWFVFFFFFVNMWRRLSSCEHLGLKNTTWI